jgi:putative membrane protein
MRILITLTVIAAVAAAVAAQAQAKRGSAQPTAQDANYLRTSIQGDRFEIVGGRMALRDGRTPQMRVLARHLVRDHSKSLAESIALAKRLGIKVPDSPTQSQVWELNAVRRLSGAQFDEWYGTLEIKDHQQDIEETTFEVAHGGNRAVIESARKELPVLRLHLVLAKRAVAVGA